MKRNEWKQRKGKITRWQWKKDSKRSGVAVVSRKGNEIERSKTMLMEELSFYFLPFATVTIGIVIGSHTPIIPRRQTYIYSFSVFAPLKSESGNACSVHSIWRRQRCCTLYHFLWALLFFFLSAFAAAFPFLKRRVRLANDSTICLTLNFIVQVERLRCMLFAASGSVTSRHATQRHTLPSRVLSILKPATVT